MDPLDKLTSSFSLDELRAERNRLDAIITRHARRKNRIDILINLLTDLDDEGGAVDESESAPAEVEAEAERPSLDDAILRIMGEWEPITVWTGDKILIQLERKGWAPGGRTPRNTVDATLSRLTKQGRLERASRGVYKLPSETSGGNGATGASVAETLDVDGV
jgi:hypothetical protein